MKTPFVIATRKYFSFLESHGFNVKSETAERIRYETDTSFVIIDRDVRSGEMNVLFGLKSNNEAQELTFCLQDILAMEKVPTNLANNPFMVYADQELAPFIEEMANETKTHAMRALSGDRLYFRRLRVYKDKKVGEYWRSMNNRAVRQKAENAWRKRDLALVTELYTSIDDELTNTERAKLEYARKHKH